MANKTPETRNENLDEEYFKSQEFEKEAKDWWKDFDKKAFSEIVSWAKFDKKLSKEENFKNAFDIKVNWMIDSNLKNLPKNDPRLTELKSLQRASNNWKSPQELIESYNEIKEIIGTRHAESKQWETDKQNQDNQKNQIQANKESQDFLDKLKTTMKENSEIEEKKRREQAKMLAENNKETQNQVASAEDILKWFLESPTS